MTAQGAPDAAGALSRGVGGPRLLSAVWHTYDASWGGGFHFNTSVGVCGGGAKGPFLCGGVALTFDAPVAVRSFYSAAPPAAEHYYGFLTGASSGMELCQGGNGGSNSSLWTQPGALTAISPDGLTVSINATWIAPGKAAPPTLIKYAWHDYPPAMPLVGRASGLPVGPFNASIAVAPPRPPPVACDFAADTDVTDVGGEVVAAGSAAQCCSVCLARGWDGCGSAVFFEGQCWVKLPGGTPVPSAGRVACTPR